MKSENKVKKLILKKETLQDLTARHAEEIKGGSCSLLTNSTPPKHWSRRCTYFKNCHK
jgi:hypothetical protein